MIDKEELYDFETKWKKIDDLGFVKVLEYSKNRKPEESYHLEKSEYISLYSVVYEILISKNPEVRQLCFDRLSSTLKFHCQYIFDKLRTNCTVITFIDKWAAFDGIVLKWVLKVFNYLSRIRNLLRCNLSLERELKTIFKTEVYDKMSTVLKENFLKLLEEYRKRGFRDAEIAKFHEFMKFLDYFEDKFEDDIIKSSKEYFKRISEENLADSYIKYLQIGAEKIQIEASNLMLFLPSVTSNLIVLKLKEIYFYTNAKKLLEMNDGFIYLLKTQNFDLLRKTFALFVGNETTLNIMLTLFKEFITEKIKDIISKFNLDNEESKLLSPKEVAVRTDFLSENAKFQNFISNLISLSFSSNNLFNVAFKEVLELVQSKQTNINTSYLLPFYLDKILHISDNETKSEDEINTIIDQSIAMFPFLIEKDVFITIYRNLLCSRLLHDDFISIDAERKVLNKLKEQCGNEYTLNIETMINDYSLNKDFIAKYKNYLTQEPNQINTKIENSFIVLTGEHWPNLNVHKLKLPEELSQLTNQMFKYYHTNFAGRTLQWALGNSLIEIEGKFNSKYTFICNTIQGVILMLFNSIGFGKEYQKDEMIKLIHFEEPNDFDEAIGPLIQANLIIRVGEGSFMLNKEFSSVSIRVKFASETSSSGEIVKKEKIEKDRSMAVDGHIIRIIKSKFRVEHNELVKLVLEQLDKFKVQVNLIKERIESLIQKELIERDKEDPNYYNYIASNN